MKKLVLVFSALVMVLSSCSSSDEETNTPPTSSSVLVKKAIVEDEDGGYTTLYTYNGNKIVKTTNSDDTSEVFTYSGDLITKIEYYTDTTLDQKDIFTYNTDNKLITYTRLDYGVEWGTKETYVYNSDGTLSVTEYIGDLTSQTQLNSTSKIYFTNGEISKTEVFEGGIKTNTITYTHDTKNNPYKNITGFNKLSISSGGGISHNILTEVDTDAGTSTYEYTYNSNDYPSTEKETYSGETYTTQYFYE
jgi:hypothetical protein